MIHKWLTTSSANFSLSSSSSGIGVVGVRAWSVRPPPALSATQYVISGGSSEVVRQPHQPRPRRLILAGICLVSGPVFMFPLRLVNWAWRQVDIWPEILPRSGLGSLGPWTSARPSPPKTSVRLVRENLSLSPSNFTFGKESRTCNKI